MLHHCTTKVVNVVFYGDVWLFYTESILPGLFPYALTVFWNACPWLPFSPLPAALNIFVSLPLWIASTRVQKYEKFDKNGQLVSSLSSTTSGLAG